MSQVPTVQIIAAITTALYGLVSLSGGIIGFQKAGSTASLIAGGASGVILLLCAGGVAFRPTWALIGALIVALALAGRFTGVLMQKREDLGAFLETGAGITAYVMIVGGFCVLVAAALALLARAVPSVAT